MSNIQYHRSTGKNTESSPIHTEPDTSLKGTLISVSLVGAFIVISWVSVFALFISRN